MLPPKIFTKNNLAFFNKSHLRPKKIILGVFAFFLLTVLSCLLWALNSIPMIVMTLPSNNNNEVALDQDITVLFSHPVQRSSIEARITPEVQGSWSFENNTWNNHLSKKMVFRPDTNFYPNELYKVEISNIRGLIRKSSSSFSFNFETEALPEIVNSSIQDDIIDVPSCDEIILSANGQIVEEIADFSFTIDPAVEITRKLLEDKKSYSVRAPGCFAQGVNYTLKASRIVQINLPDGAAIPEYAFTLHFVTKNPPSISDYAPKGDYVNVNTKEINITFLESMVAAEVLSQIQIDPTINGSWQWQSEQKLVFIPLENLLPATVYTITIPKGVHDTKNGYLEQDIKLKFATAGPVKVISFSPRDGQTNIGKSTSVSATFDQSVEKTSAEEHFSIVPQLSGNFSWQDNTMRFTPNSPLSDSTYYKVSIANGVKSINGLPSDNAYEATFLTSDRVISLQIKLDYQDKPLSCEAASLKMALAYRGVNVSENEIMDIIGFDPTPHVGNIWGNPHNAFVGDINGRQNTTGYGVYWEPIEKAAKNYRNAQSFSNWSVLQATRELENGNPIIVWGVTGKSYSDSWKTTDGITIDAWKGEHARVLTGFKGTSDNPKEFYLNDPYAGKITWTRQAFESNWSTFNNSGVVVY